MDLADPQNVASDATVTAPEELETGAKGEVVVEVGSAAEAAPTGEGGAVRGRHRPAGSGARGWAPTFEVGPFAEAGTVELVADYRR